MSVLLSDGISMQRAEKHRAMESERVWREGAEERKEALQQKKAEEQQVFLIISLCGSRKSVCRRRWNAYVVCRRLSSKSGWKNNKNSNNGVP